MLDTLLLSACAILAQVSASPAEVAGTPDVPAESGADRGSIHGVLHFGDAAKPGGNVVVPTDAVVYLRGEALSDRSGKHAQPGSAPEDAAPLATLDQEDIAFVPHVVALAVGDALLIRNSDAILHNVHTQSSANRVFNRASLGQMSFEKTFKKPEVIHVGCDIHSQMSAYIVVVPNRFFTQPDAKGVFNIEGIPAGSYSLVAWHEAFGEVVSEVTVTAGEAAEAELKFSTRAKG